jgi:hypothetical protein
MTNTRLQRASQMQFKERAVVQVPLQNEGASSKNVIATNISTTSRSISS